METHDCMQNRKRVPHDDVLIERCSMCGKVRHESDGVRPMAWFTREEGFPFKYAYDDPHNDPDALEIFKELK